MDPLTLATTLLTLGGEVAKIAADAIAASQAGDDAKALALLDQAIAKLREQAAGLDAALAQVKVNIAARIDAKFPKDAPTS